MLRRLFIYLFSVLIFSQTVFSQIKGEKEFVPPLTRILFVFDASHSMIGMWQSDKKIDIARRLLINTLDSLKGVDNLELALRAYGHQKHYPPKFCDDTRLEVRFGANNHEEIKHRLRSLDPKGTTPIAYALRKAGDDFPPCDNCRNIIILITDGLEECDGDPCAVSESLQKKGVVLKPFIIGIGRNFQEQFECVGTYFDASSEEQFDKALDYVVSQALNKTTAQVNILDSYGNATESNVNMTFYDSFSGKVKYNYVHTFNSKGVPDTLLIDPLITYNIVVNSIPIVRKDNVKLTSGMHNIIPISAPQGYIRLKVDGNDNSLKSLQCIVRQDGKSQTVNVQNFGLTEKYLTGIFDLEVLCLPRIYINDVEVIQSSTTTVEIPVPGIAVFQKNTLGFGGVYVMRGDEQEWVYNFRENSPMQETLILQPGQYIAIFRARFADKSIYTVERKFRITSGRTTNIKIF